ncbi:hypothetical protein AB0I02_33600 [Streptomyces phaeochromogenes]
MSNTQVLGGLAVSPALPDGRLRDGCGTAVGDRRDGRGTAARGIPPF